MKRPISTLPSLSAKIGAGAACVLLAGSLVACGQPAETETKSVQEETQTTETDNTKDQGAEEAALSIPNAVFTNSAGEAVDVTGKALDLSYGNSDSKLRAAGVFTQDRLLLVDGLSEEPHAAIVDGEGNEVAVLDDALAAYGTVEEIDPTLSYGFTNDRIIVPAWVQPAGDSGSVEIHVVFDRDGREVFSVGEAPGCTIQGNPNSRPQRFFDGERSLSNLGMIVDVNGAVVASTAKPAVIAGNGYYAGTSYDKGKFFANDGSLVLDLENFPDTRYAFGINSTQALLGSNVIQLKGAENTDSGRTVNLQGLYDVASGAWVLRPTDGIESVSTSYNGLFYVSSMSKDVLDGTFDRTTSDLSGYDCILDTKGTLVFDMAMSGIEGAEEVTEFRAQYLTDGYWYLTSDAKEFEPHIIYFNENGSYVGAEPTSLVPSKGYEQLNRVLTIDN